jgi:hypothetical protein
MRQTVLLCTAMVALTAAPAIAETVASAAPENPPQARALRPDFSGIWWHPSLPGLEPPASGPGPVLNLARRENGTENYDELVGDYKNPILQPWAAKVVKTFGDMSRAGITYPNPANQCWPEPVPFIYKSFGMQMLQAKDHITMMFDANHQFRVIRLNAKHPAHVTPSWYGDSVGHYEGDTLVIDTVGTKVDRPYSMLDLYGTPFTKSLHVIERIHMISYDEAKGALERDLKENQPASGFIDRSYRGKHLQVQLTIQDKGAFTTPWTATITYRPASIVKLREWPEDVCSENIHEYIYNRDTDVPKAARPDF